MQVRSVKLEMFSERMRGKLNVVIYFHEDLLKYYDIDHTFGDIKSHFKFQKNDKIHQIYWKVFSLNFLKLLMYKQDVQLL